LWCKQTHNTFNALKTQENWLQINSVGQKLSTVWVNFSQGAGERSHSEKHCVYTASGERVIVLSQCLFKEELLL
jgi:hypothetical protein